MKWYFALRLLWAAAATMVSLRGEGDDYSAALQRARTYERVARLTSPDGWLTLVGLHFLKPGDNTIGAGKGNDVVLAGGPALFGTITQAANGRLTLALAPQAEAQIDGKSFRTAELRPEEMGKPTLVTFGPMSFFALERGGKKGLRVKDSTAEARTHFLGLDYFPTDPAWRIEAQWVAFERSRQIPLTNILGQVEPALVPGKAVFHHNGQTVELWAIDEGPDEPLFFVISDATSGRESYGAARFVYAERPKEGKVVLDFNQAENPPCAFTSFATCPLPPAQNRLPFAVNAGEKKYRGGHE